MDQKSAEVEVAPEFEKILFRQENKNFLFARQPSTMPVHPLSPQSFPPIFALVSPG